MTSDTNMTERQAAIIAAFEAAEGNCQKAADTLGLSRGTVYNTVKRWQGDMLRQGRVPPGYVIKSFTTMTCRDGDVRTSQKVGKEGGDRDDFPYVPDPKAVKFTTTNFDSSRRVTSQWVREEKDQVEKAKLWKDYAEALLEPVLFTPLCDRHDEAVSTALVKAKDQCAVYPIGDYHVGMMAWGAETRSDNYDLKIAESLLQEAAETLMDAAPPCETAVVAFMGDFVHFDSFKPVTPAHGHLLDADSRFGKVGRTAMRIVRHIIAAARRRHRHVHVIFLRGNHDPAVAELINMFLGMFYEGEPGITIDTSPSYFRYYEFGKNLMGFAHGDKLKPDRMPMVMANDMAEAWGRCPERVIFTGHVHHKSADDKSGVGVETVPVLIPNDAYAADAGYRSRRRMEVVVFDREFGESERHVYNPVRFYRGR